MFMTEMDKYLRLKYEGRTLIDVLKKGDTIYYDKHAGHGIQYKDTLYQVIRDRDVILVE